MPDFPPWIAPPLTSTRSQIGWWNKKAGRRPSAVIGKNPRPSKTAHAGIFMHRLALPGARGHAGGYRPLFALRLRSAGPLRLASHI
jgi:hypothetical protein